MSQPYVGEIRCFGFNFAPVDWHMCDGSLLAISQYDALFELIGTTYGGDGQNTFALPNLKGRSPIHQGQGSGLSNYVIGQNGGVENASLSVQQIPLHNHSITGAIIAPGGANEHSATPATNTYFATSTPDQVYNTTPTIDTAFAPTAIGLNGGSQPHDNQQPYLALNFCISLFGIFPSAS
jgi:microcystin-dependent protein